MGFDRLQDLFNADPSRLPPSPAEVEAFCRSVIVGDNTVLKKFLNKYKDALNEYDEYGRTALMYVGAHIHADSLKLLLENGADVHAEDNVGQTVLMYGALYGHEEGVEALLHAGADINAADNNGMTALMHAATRGLKDIVKLLLDGGADINAVDNNGMTALMHAVWMGKTEVAAVLEQYAEEQKQHLLAEQAAQQAQWLQNTDCSKGTDQSVRAPRLFKVSAGRGLVT